MKKKNNILFGIMIVLAVVVLIIIIFMIYNANKKLMLGEFGGWPSLAGNSGVNATKVIVDGKTTYRTNIPDLINKLEELNANAYLYYITSNPTEFDDFKLFLETTKDKKIDTYMWIMPPGGGSTPGNIVCNACTISYPYNFSYMLWAEAVANLSLQYKNLKGWTIDDFFTHTYFTPELVKEFTDKAKSINSNLKFYPIVYAGNFNQLSRIGQQMKYCDGIIFPYYNGVWGIDVNHIYYNDLQVQIDLFNLLYNTPGNNIEIRHPNNNYSLINSGVSFDVLTNNKEQIFIYVKNNIGGSIGYVYLKAYADGTEVYSKDFSRVNRNGSSIEYWTPIYINTFGSEKLTISLKNSGGNLYNYGVSGDIFTVEEVNNINATGNWSASVKNYYSGQKKLIGMPYATKLSNSTTVPSPSYVNNITKIFLDNAKTDKNILGVMIYVLPMNNKTDGSTYNTIKELFGEYK